MFRKLLDGVSSFSPGDRAARKGGEANRGGRRSRYTLVKLIGAVADDAWKRAVSSRPIFSTVPSYDDVAQEGIVCSRYTNDISATLRALSIAWYPINISKP